MNSIKSATSAGALLVLGLATMGPAVFASGGSMEERIENLVYFSGTNRTVWRVVNDGVMGGVSRSAMRITEQSTGVFEGNLSLENGGGFASVRASAGRHDFSAFDGLDLRLRGDGRTYQFRLHMDGGFDGIAYSVPFETSRDEWVTVRIPFEVFVPTFRGRSVIEAPPLDRSHIRQLAFMLADKRPGSFSLEIESVRAWKVDEEES